MPTYYQKKEQFRMVPLEKIQLYVSHAPDLQAQVSIVLAWLTGARIADILNLRKEDIIIEQDAVTVVIDASKGGKVGYPTFSYNDPYVSSLLVPYVQQLENGTRLFVRTKRSHQQILYNLNKKLYGHDTQEYVTFHYLRHSRITYLARVLEASPEEIKSWTGQNSEAFEEYFRSRKVERFKGQIR